MMPQDAASPSDTCYSNLMCPNPAWYWVNLFLYPKFPPQYFTLSVSWRFWKSQLQDFWDILTYTLDLYSCSRTKNEAWITHLNFTHYLFHTIFSSDKSVFSENKHTDIMAENNVTLIPWEKIIRASITAVLLDIHCVLFASELVFAAVTEAFGK